MLEPTFKQLINQILKVEMSHFRSNQDKEMLSRNWEFIFQDWDGWTILSLSTRTSVGGYWIYPRLCPLNYVDELKKELPHFNFVPSCSAYTNVMSGNDHSLEPYWKEDKGFNQSEIQLYFERQHYGHGKGKESYIEFNQLVTHPLNLHWSPRKNSYCRVDDQGEEIEKIKVIDNENLRLILIRRKTLDKLLYLGKWTLIRYFDFNRRKVEIWNYEFDNKKIIKPEEYEAIFEMQSIGIEPMNYIEFRGAEILRPITPKEQLLSWRTSDEEENQKQYATFTVQDWKNKKILNDYSISPENFANYFTESDLPFEISPIFFNAAVLDKYKNNPDKYELKERTISCYGGWYLKTYDINEYNQVHTYAIYLSHLPYKEQLYWKSFNEEPKGGLSKRSIQTDFKAKFPDEKPLLSQLKASLYDLQNIKINGEVHSIWSPKGGEWNIASKGLFYLKTENQNQWHDFIITLANTVTEGLLKKSIKRIAEAFGDVDNKTGSLGLIKFILINTNNDNLIKEIHTVLNDLQKLRGQGKAHGNWTIPNGSLITDAEARLKSVIAALKKLKFCLEKIGRDD
ncbi:MULTISPECIES: hypothetical protein [unclassified Halobacteriovorax]|uniref:hypothetical protein n=1 Tax=unclassified Halobacteriovorax TaxID=2639665 RepID=UPI00399B18BA